jgi:hypothetical protein
LPADTLWRGAEVLKSRRGAFCYFAKKMAPKTTK